MSSQHMKTPSGISISCESLVTESAIQALYMFGTNIYTNRYVFVLLFF